MHEQSKTTNMFSKNASYKKHFLKIIILIFLRAPINFSANPNESQFNETTDVF